MATTGVEDSTFINKSYPRLVDFEAQFRNSKPGPSAKTVVVNAIKNYAKNFDIKKCFLGTFPFIETLATYDIKENLINDVIGGVMAGVTMIPQSMAFASLSTLPHYVGLYMSFFAPLTYFIFGTSRHLAWGCVAIVSLMMADIMDKYEDSDDARNYALYLNRTHYHGSVNLIENQNEIDTVVPDIKNGDILNSILRNSTEKDIILEALTQRRIEVASAVTVITGCLFVLASLIGFSKISLILSNSLIKGFTVGVSFHISSSQMKDIFGLSIKRYNGTGRILKTWIAIFENIQHTNLTALLISLVCMVIIFLVKKFINERYKHRLRVPIPIELFVVVAGILLSYYLDFMETCEVTTIGKIPSGMPEPKFPDLSLATDYIGDSLVVIIISYAQSLAMAKTMGLEYDYDIDSKQEMLATGICSAVCGFFSGYTPGGSVSISLIQSSAGGKSRVASLFSAAIVLLVILVLGPYIKYLPNCVMAAIIFINLRTMFSKLLNLPNDWRTSKYDCAVWVFAWIATVFLGTGMALLASVAFSVFLVILRSLIKPVIEIGQIKLDSASIELRSLENYECAHKFQSVKLVKIKTPILFYNSDMFVSSVYSQTGIDPIKTKSSQKRKGKGKKNKTEYSRLDENQLENTDIDNNLESLRVLTVKTIILDISEVAFVDVMGMQAFETVIREYTSIKIDVLVTSVPENIFDILQSTGFWKKHQDKLFLNVTTALASLSAIKESYNSYSSTVPMASIENLK